jgi:hypothetical protein
MVCVCVCFVYTSHVFGFASYFIYIYIYIYIIGYSSKENMNSCMLFLDVGKASNLMPFLLNLIWIFLFFFFFFEICKAFHFC